ncbi:hypothetical protein V1290_002230 [Bradyrhizobium sp. AZCC 1578]|uniref:hypothetical protein n=1 Tax=Bradyrhizobium sp. AZCC 1578 TaxID=3117027 RepID=UPI002FF33DB1
MDGISADLAKNDDGRPINSGTHCSQSLTTGYGPVSPRAQDYQLTRIPMTQFHEFKEKQFSEAAKFINGYLDPIGLAPKMVS